MSALLVALGAAVGAPARLLAGRALDRTVHWGTLLVNLLGSALLGWLVGHGVGTDAMTLWGTGFCGAFTTYSAVAVQSVNKGGWRGLAYAVITVVACLGVAWLGYALAR
ncbi:fluoride efflux transporter FluC [Nocardioides marmorisolisilvae]|uniref:Fluoride-specific ion channel FluC n=1 Tax=Nocardioides marmorisolisilvae TaxID=1542737 RepID=A0A3N0DPI0_9ACTN|nr:CrcB family protein [Nocardioides marmorisolisilvae]RNL77542.1 CrcB family protein [Nocardioides marmorisolisilvae]